MTDGGDKSPADEFKQIMRLGVIPYMHLSHINVTMPKGSEDIARRFYVGQLGLYEIPKPEPMRVRGGVWFDAGGLDVHVSVEEQRGGGQIRRGILVWSVQILMACARD